MRKKDMENEEKDNHVTYETMNWQLFIWKKAKNNENE